MVFALKKLPHFICFHWFSFFCCLPRSHSGKPNSKSNVKKNKRDFFAQRIGCRIWNINKWLSYRALREEKKPFSPLACRLHEWPMVCDNARQTDDSRHAMEVKMMMRNQKKSFISDCYQMQEDKVSRIRLGLSRVWLVGVEKNPFPTAAHFSWHKLQRKKWNFW